MFLFFQECVKPVKIDRKPGKVAKIRIEDDGSYMEVAEVNIYLSLYCINVLATCIRTIELNYQTSYIHLFTYAIHRGNFHYTCFIYLLFVYILMTLAIFVTQSGEEKKLQKAQITLNDCLACSGCITSAESVLITQQSQEELYNVLQENLRLQQASDNKWR